MAVLGAGKSGVAAARLGRREGAEVSIFDNGPRDVPEETRARIAEIGATLVEGGAALLAADGCELAVLSPGIDAKAPLAAAFYEQGVPLIGEIEFANRFTDKPVVAITGTNGKTTTTEIVECILNAAGQRTVAAGNYGTTYSDVVMDHPECDVMTLEVSSFQLETIVDFRPSIAVWLNFAPDHLDRYSGLEAYRDAKLRIFENQGAGDHAVINAEEDLGELAAEIVTFSSGETKADFELRGNEITFKGETVVDYDTCRLRGLHNAENLMAALAIGHLRGIAFPDMAAAIAEYQPPRHRCELVVTINGHEYINDSKATNLHALERSLVSQKKPVVLIAGGKDKGLPFEDLRDVVQAHATHVVAIGEIRDALAAAWSPAVSCETASDLEEAVTMARAASAPAQTILFSPGTSSFDMFGGYEERGDAFRDSILRTQ